MKERKKERKIETKTERYNNQKQRKTARNNEIIKNVNERRR
jgi:hypothetical protein